MHPTPSPQSRGSAPDALRDPSAHQNGTHVDDGAPVAVNITGLARHFGIGERRVHAVREINLSIAQGEVVALLGPNGAGKTTTLDMLLGLNDPSAGSVRVFGASPRSAVASGRLSAVLQTGGLLADITVLETLQVIAGFHHATARIPEVMERTGLTEIARRKVGKCSGGEQQRVKFALALLPDPDVIVLDEPTAGMDVNARRQFWHVMRAEADAGRTVIFATHYLEEAEQFARRTIVMNHGVVVADGSTAKLRASLGGRTVSAMLPSSHATASLESLLAAPQFAGIADLSESDLHLDAGRLTVRTPNSDALAAALLAFGATDLEITAPTLETAFTSLTED